jgi:hypothetical protein
VVSTRQISKVAVESAQRALLEAELDQVGSAANTTRNEPWFHTYIGFGLNDFLRRSFIGDANDFFVTFETSVSWINGFYGLKRPPPGRPPGALTGGQRFDLLVWSSKQKPLGLIEIKNQPLGSDEPDRDLKKLRDGLFLWSNERNCSIQWGIFLFCVRCDDGRITAEKRNEKINASAKRYLELVKCRHRDLNVSLHVYDGATSTGSAAKWASILLKRK